MERLDKYISKQASLSRKLAREKIKKGLVKVNDNLVIDIAYKVEVLKDRISLDGEVLSYNKYIYIMMNKRRGLVSARKDKENMTVMDELDKKYLKKNLSILGRLDKDTEGLLLISNDGDFSHKLMSPKYGIEKTYYVELKYPIDSKYVDIFKNGIYLKNEDITVYASKLEIIDTYSCFLTISEGKFHQVKRMFTSVNNDVKYLKRVKIGNLNLDENLKLGQYRELTEKEVQDLKDLL